MKVLKKVTENLKSLYRQNIYLRFRLKRLLRYPLFKPHLDYGCTSWFPLLNENLKHKLQAAQSKCICLCLDLPPCSHIGAARKLLKE